MTTLYLDFETTSSCDLRERGLYNYARHSATKVLCMGYAFDDEPAEIWQPVGFLPERVKQHVSDGGLVVAHNASFEIDIWNHALALRDGDPFLFAYQIHDTMAMAYAMSLPGALENLAPALGIADGKDAVGKRTMMKLATLDDAGKFARKVLPSDFTALYEYCKKDVEVERECYKKMLVLSPAEQRVWHLDLAINRRGVRVNIAGVSEALALVDEEKDRLDDEMFRVTGNVVGRCTDVQMLSKWVRAQGVEMPSIDKAAVLDALSGDLPENVRKALKLRQEAAKSSTAKLQSMLYRAGFDDERLHGMFAYHGAATGRWAGRGVQLHNLPRPRKSVKPKDVENIIANLANRDYIDMCYGPVLDAVSDSLRGFLIPSEGHDFLAADFASIEARVLAWLAGDQATLDVFEGHGKIYEHAAAGIFGVGIDEVVDSQRQIGKVATLALGYGGGRVAFQTMAKAYAIHVDEDHAETIKVAWRDSHPEIVAYWRLVEDAALEAVRSQGTVFHVREGKPGSVAFVCRGSFLWCRLPSGRLLCYPYPTLKERETPWGQMKEALHYCATNSVTNRWEETGTYGGSLVENITQAVARDILAEALLRLDDALFHTVLHVHDEIVAEIESTCDDRTVNLFVKLMCQAPSWAPGLPISASPWRGKSFRK